MPLALVQLTNPLIVGSYCFQAAVSRRPLVVRASGSYHSNWRTQSVAVVSNGNSNSNGNSSSNGTSMVPRQMQTAARPLPVSPVTRPTPGDLNNRFATILKHFPTALGVDDFIARVEVALCYFGFTGDNTIGKYTIAAAAAARTAASLQQTCY